MVEVCARCVTLTISRDRACPAEGPISLAGMCAGLTYCIDQNPGVFGCIRMTINYCNFCPVLFAPQRVSFPGGCHDFILY